MLTSKYMTLIGYRNNLKTMNGTVIGLYLCSSLRADGSPIATAHKHTHLQSVLLHTFWSYPFQPRKMYGCKEKNVCKIQNRYRQAASVFIFLWLWCGPYVLTKL